MRKQELVQLHKLMSLILKDMRENTEGDIDQIVDLEDYQDMGVSPEGIHQNKQDQREALLELARSIGQGIEEHEEELKEMSPTADTATEETERYDSRYDQIKEQRDEAEALSQTMNTSDGLDSAEDEVTDEDDGPDWSRL